MKITRISFYFNCYGSKQHGLVFLAFGWRRGGGSNNVWVLVTVAFICFIDYDDDADSCRYGNVTVNIYIIGKAYNSYSLWRRSIC